MREQQHNIGGRNVEDRLTSQSIKVVCRKSDIYHLTFP